jgi:predicted membrane-bound mannosyltransferase
VDIAAPVASAAVVVGEAHQKMKRHPFSIFFFFSCYYFSKSEILVPYFQRMVVTTAIVAFSNVCAATIKTHTFQVDTSENTIGMPLPLSLAT